MHVWRLCSPKTCVFVNIWYVKEESDVTSEECISDDVLHTIEYIFGKQILIKFKIASLPLFIKEVAEHKKDIKYKIRNQICYKAKFDFYKYLSSSVRIYCR